MIPIIVMYPVLTATVLSIILLKLYVLMSTGRLTNKERLEGKTIVITGANAGIGKVVARQLAERGARIIMACRNLETAKKARDEIIERTGNEKVTIKHIDLTSLTSVRKFAKEIHEMVDKIDVLINNAGAYGLRNKKTEDGLNVLMQINHFGPFLLTNLLLDLVKKAPKSRIIFTSSLGHLFHNFDLDNLNSDKCHWHWFCYANSKLSNIMTANNLARKLEGTGITVNSLHPGVVKTEIFGNFYNFLGFFSALMKAVIDFVSKNVEDGAKTTVFLATDPYGGQVTGKYFADCTESYCLARTANNTEFQDRLWTKSEELVGLKPDEKFY